MCVLYCENENCKWNQIFYNKDYNPSTILNHYNEVFDNNSLDEVDHTIEINNKSYIHTNRNSIINDCEDIIREIKSMKFTNYESYLEAVKTGNDVCPICGAKICDDLNCDVNE